MNDIDGDAWSIIHLDMYIFINPIKRSIIFEYGKYWVPPPTDLDEHILIKKRY